MLQGAIIGAVVGLVVYLIQNKNKKAKENTDVLDDTTNDDTKQKK